MPDEVVEDVERIEVQPAAGDDPQDPEVTAPANKEGDEGERQEGKGDDPETSPEGKPEALVERKPEPQATAEPGTVPLADGIQETPRERALRLELETTRGKLRDQRTGELMPPAAPGAAPRELTEEEQKVLEKYPQEQLGALKEVLPVLAKALGFVKADELAGQTYTEKSQGELDAFLDRHPEYLPQNDSDGALWNSLKDEFQLYRPPADPRDMKRLLERCHQTVFGIKPGNLPTPTAAVRKVETASHGAAAGAGAPGAGGERRSAAPANPGIRFDMLKGFSEEEIADLQG